MREAPEYLEALKKASALQPPREGWMRRLVRFAKGAFGICPRPGCWNDASGNHVGMCRDCWNGSKSNTKS